MSFSVLKKHLFTAFILSLLLTVPRNDAHADDWQSLTLDCGVMPCKDAVPGSETFQRLEGSLNVMKAMKGNDTLGYVFLSTDIVDIPAYSGKPVATIIGMDPRGNITGVKVIKHNEPILLVGIPESALHKFVDQYKGVNVTDKVTVGGKSEDPKVKKVDAISGATVTVIAEDRTIMKSGRVVGEKIGLVKKGARATGHLVTDFKTMTWQELIDAGLLGHLKVTPEEVGETPSEPGQPWVDIYFGYLNLPVVGRNLMGENNYRWVLDEIKDGSHAFLIVSNGDSSFKGSGFVRGAIFERFNFEQRSNNFTFRDVTYYNFFDVEAQGNPGFKEGGVFIIREEGFSPYEPFVFNFLSARIVGTIERKFDIFKTEYRLPKKWAVVEKEGEREEAPYEAIWKANISSIVFLLALLGVIIFLFLFRTRLVKNRTAAKWSRYGVMAVSLVFIGYYKMAQPSVTQALTLTHELLGIMKKGFNWGLFLLDPMIFILWWFIAITIVIWGRGVFCGWICPYGVLTEFAYRVFHTVFPKRFKYELPRRAHNTLIYLKYVIWGVLLLVSFKSMTLAEKLSEIEPFKTTFLVGPLNRTWPFMLYFFALLGLSLVMYRVFCKYICPLGAGLAAPSTFRLFGIKRREFCTKCSICARECHQLAIDDSGKIDKRECFYCLECEENFWDTEKCPVLIKEKKSEP